MRIVARCSQTRAGRVPRRRGNGHAQAVGRLYMHGRQCTPQHSDNGWVHPVLQRGLTDRPSAWLRGAARARPLSQTIEKQTPVPCRHLPFRIRPKNQYRRWRPLAKAMRCPNRNRASHAGNGCRAGHAEKERYGGRPHLPPSRPATCHAHAGRPATGQSGRGFPPLSWPHQAADELPTSRSGRRSTSAACPAVQTPRYRCVQRAVASFWPSSWCNSQGNQYPGKCDLHAKRISKF